jgi:hypothetical protein
LAFKAVSVRKILSFIVQVRHPDNAKSWRNIQLQLSQTLRSIAAQDHAGWQAVVVANHAAEMPELPAGVSVKRVDFPANPLPHPRDSRFREASRLSVGLDKGRRVLAGMLHALELSGGAPGHFMIVDDDDFVHRGLTGFVAANPQANGWYFKEGYIWTEGGTLLFRYDGFFLQCGTSHIVRHDLFGLPASMAVVDESYLHGVLGNHVFVRDHLAQAGTPLAPLPFCGAVYRVGHSESWSHSRGIWRRYFITKAMLRNPVELARRVSRLRLKDREIEAVYFGQPA